MPDVGAPELDGAGGWIGVARPLSTAALRGRAVLVWFWSASSAECHRLLDDIRPLEDLHGDDMVVVGVHSPRFPEERRHDVVVDAVARLAIAHPVLDDADHRCFEAWGADDWPTVVLVDPAGEVVGSVSGPGCGAPIGAAVAELVGLVPAGGRRRRLPPPDRPLLPAGPLAYPGKVAASHDGRLLAIADTGHDQVLVCTADGVVLEAHTGYLAPQGVRFDGPDGGVLICDTGADRVVRTGGEVLADELASPWDLVAHGRSWVVAEAAGNRILRIRPGELRARQLAGTGEEGADDGPSPKAMLAQPSGVAVTAGGVVFTDASSSCLRMVVEDRRGAEVSTLAGGGLLDLGHEDGPGAAARFQNPLGVAASPGGGPVYVADTYNSAIRVWEDGRLRTLPVRGLRHPGGIDLLPDGRLVVADTGNSRIVVVDPATGSVEPVDVDETWVHGSDGEPVRLRPGGTAEVDVGIELVDEDLDRSGAEPPVRVTVSARPAPLLAGGPVSAGLDAPRGRVRVVAGREGSGVLLVEVAARTTSARGGAQRVHRCRHLLDVAGG